MLYGCFENSFLQFLAVVPLKCEVYQWYGNLKGSDFRTKKYTAIKRCAGWNHKRAETLMTHYQHEFKSHLTYRNQRV